MKRTLSISALALFTIIASMLLRNPALAAINSVVPISQELATSIAGQLFPAGLDLNTGNLLITGPKVVFVDSKRLALKVRIQAYYHSPDQGIAISEMGWAEISGGLDFDPETRQILLHNPSIDTLEFDRENEASRDFHSDISENWLDQIANPIRTDIPPHPYIILFRDSIRNITYDGQNINVVIAYE
jgi:hypothetical protein